MERKLYTLYSYPTPNSQKVKIMLEKTLAPYNEKQVDITKGEQFSDTFMKISPNRKIPVLFDEEKNTYLFESNVILLYLAEKHERLNPLTSDNKYKILQWLTFQSSHVGPLLGQYGHFHVYASENIPYAKNRYKKEAFRLFDVINLQLSKNKYIAGSNLSIADIAIWPWLRCFEKHYNSNFHTENYSALIHWFENLAAREPFKSI